MTMRFAKLSLPVLAIASLSSCMPHLSQQQCQTMNWHQVGYGDGSQGSFQRNLNPAIADCAKFQLTVNTDAYAKGWRAGTRSYCNPNRAYQLGSNGITYNPVCPSDLSGAFSNAWHRGLRRYCVGNTGYNLGRSGKPFPSFCAPDQVNAFRNAYDAGHRRHQQQENLQSNLDSVNAQISSTQNQLADNRKNISDWQNTLSADQLPPEGRHELKQKIKDARASIDDLQAQLDRLFQTRDHLQNTLSRVGSH